MSINGVPNQANNAKLPGVNITSLLSDLPKTGKKAMLENGQWINPDTKTIAAKYLNVNPNEIKVSIFNNKQ